MGALQSWLFAWEASWGRALTLDNLERKGKALAKRRFLCGEGGEMVDHLLIHCSKTRILWGLLLAIFGVNWVVPLSVSETL